LLNEVGSLVWYFEVRVRYRSKKFKFAILSPDEFLFLINTNIYTSFYCVKRNRSFCDVAVHLLAKSSV